MTSYDVIMGKNESNRLNNIKNDFFVGEKYKIGILSIFRRLIPKILGFP